MIKCNETENLSSLVTSISSKFTDKKQVQWKLFTTSTFLQYEYISSMYSTTASGFFLSLPSMSTTGSSQTSSVSTSYQKKKTTNDDAPTEEKSKYNVCQMVKPFHQLKEFKIPSDLFHPAMPQCAAQNLAQGRQCLLYNHPHLLWSNLLIQLELIGPVSLFPIEKYHDLLLRQTHCTPMKQLFMLAFSQFRLKVPQVSVASVCQPFVQQIS